MNSSHSHYRRRFGKALLHIGCFFVLLVACEDCWRKKPLQAPSETVINIGNMPNGNNMCYLNSVMQIIARLYPDMFEGHSDEQAVAGKAIVEKIKEDKEAVKNEEADALYNAFLEANTNFTKSKYEDAYESLRALYCKYIPGIDEKLKQHVIKQDMTLQSHADFKNLEPLTYPLGLPLDVGFGEKSDKVCTMQEHIDREYFAEQVFNDHEFFESEKFENESEEESLEKKLIEKYQGYTVKKHQIQHSEKHTGKFKVQVLGSVKKTNQLQGLEALPNNILPIRMKRFKNKAGVDSSKLKDVDSSDQTWCTDGIKTAISKPFCLTIKAENTTDNRARNCELVGFVKHASMHYTAYIKVNGQWRHYDALKCPKVFLINDENAKKAAKEAYLYFYKAA